MTDNLQDLIAQREQLDRKISEIKERRLVQRNDAWMEIDVTLEKLVNGKGKWRKDDYVFDLHGVTVTLNNRTDPSTWMTIRWGDSYKAEFSDPPPVAAVLAFIDAL